MNKDIAWGSHLPILIRLVTKTNGAILELGTGLYSTPFLHWACYPERILYSYENDLACFNMVKDYASINHKVHFVIDWSYTDFSGKYEIALIDHAPSQRRIVDIKRLAYSAKFIVVHDTQRGKHFWGGDIPAFKYRYDYKLASPYTSVLSNYEDPINWV